MSLKGTIKPDHYPKNKYTLTVPGLPPLTILSIGDLEQEVSSAELPDRTRVSGGQRGMLETDVTTPAHHQVEQAAWEVWFKEGQDPVSPTYKKTCTLTQPSISGGKTRVVMLSGVWVMKRSEAGREMNDDGDQVTITYGLSIDDVSVISL